MRKIYEGKKYWISHDFCKEEYRLQPCIVLSIFSVDNATCNVKMLCDNTELLIHSDWLQNNPEKLKYEYNKIMNQFKKQENQHDKVLILNDEYLKMHPETKYKYVVKIDEYSKYVKNRISKSNFVKIFDSNGNVIDLDKEWIEE